MRLFYCLVICFCLCTLGPCLAQSSISQAIITLKGDYNYGNQQLRHSIALLNNGSYSTEPHYFPFLPPDAKLDLDCARFLKERRNTKLTLVFTGTVGLVLMVAGVVDGLSNLNLYGGGGSSFSNTAAPLGTIILLGSGLCYAVAIPSLNKKHKHCLQ